MLPLKFGHKYELQWAKVLTKSAPHARILDFGCGDGRVVYHGLKDGLNIFGVDIFYGGSSSKQHVIESGLLGTRIFEITQEGIIPFPDETFEVVLSNQVFEHVNDFDGPLREIHRAMKPGGLFILHFPTSEVILEGHIGIPFAHWFARGSRLRYGYTYLLRVLGFGFHKIGGAPPDQWTDRQLNWIDTYTFYKTVSEVRRAFSRYFIIVDEAGDLFMKQKLSSIRNSGYWSQIVNCFASSWFIKKLHPLISGRTWLLKRKD
jgi:SAM-dependent methyltransferase